MVEWAALEMRYLRKWIVSSNLTPSAFLRGKKAQLISRIFLKVLFFRVSERLPTGRKRRSRRIAGRISIPPQEILRVRRVTFVFLCQRKKRKEKKEREIA